MCIQNKACHSPFAKSYTNIIYNIQYYKKLSNNELKLCSDTLQRALQRWCYIQFFLIYFFSNTIFCFLFSSFPGCRSCNSEEREPTTITGEVDFLEAGVSFFQRQCVKRGDSGVSAVSYRQRGSGAGPSNRRRPPESLVGGTPLDQLWLWKCFNYT